MTPDQMRARLAQLYDVIAGYTERNLALPFDTTRDFLQLTAELLRSQGVAVPERRFRRGDRW